MSIVMNSSQKIHPGRHRRSASNLVFDIVVVLIAAFAFIVVAYPIYFIIIASFSNSNLVNQGKVLFWIRDFNTFGYEKIFQDSRIWTGYRNTIFYSVVGTLINLAVTLPAAYVFSRKEFREKKVLMPLFVFTMYFSGGLIPGYLVIKKLHLLNTIWAMMIPGAMSVYNMIITRSFMESSIPDDLYEAAQLDGCSHFTYFYKIILPLSKAVTSVIFLYYMVGHWNNFFSGLMYLNKEELQPLQVVLRGILLSNQAFEGGSGAVAEGVGGYAQQYADQIKFAVIIVSTIPVLCIYPVIQKYFEKGVMIGAVKG